MDVAVDTKQQTMGSVAFPISRDALDEMSRLSQGRINYVQLSIGNVRRRLSARDGIFLWQMSTNSIRGIAIFI